ncbi:MAG: Gfo/Idh/MocA family protein [Pyrinomonadaceae bacterium]
MTEAAVRRKLRWGLIGCGDIARKRVAPALRDLPNCDLVAVNRANFAQAESFAKEFGASKWYSTWQQLLADDEIEAVYIATPVDLHAVQAIAAAESRKHVLCEKPMALNVAECDRMIAASDANQVKLGVAYYRHFYPVITRIKEILISGEIGKPVIAQANAFERFDPEPLHPRRWLLEKERSGGGPMFDFGCHRIEVLMNLFGSIKDTRSLMGKVHFSREVEDTAVAMFRFETGLQAVLSVTHAVSLPADTLDIYGSLGSIKIAVLNDGNINIRNRDGERVETHPPHSNLHQPLIDDFAQAVLTDREPQVNGPHGRNVAKVEADIYQQAGLSLTQPATLG